MLLLHRSYFAQCEENLTTTANSSVFGAPPMSIVERTRSTMSKTRAVRPTIGSSSRVMSCRDKRVTGNHKLTDREKNFNAKKLTCRPSTYAARSASGPSRRMETLRSMAPTMVESESLAKLSTCGSARRVQNPSIYKIVIDKYE